MIEIDAAFIAGTFKLRVAFRAGRGVTALFGPSGSGKSLTLNLIAGLLRPDEGSITLGGRILADAARGIFVPPHRRHIGFVFQDSHLFPHLSVRQNLRFGRWFAPREERTIAFEAVVETLGISHLLSRQPAKLSGGERQRVAMGRALLSGPRLLLFDEPLSALDLERKLEILPFIEWARDEFRLPMIYVSHAIEEVARLADTVVVLEEGRVKAKGAPSEMLAVPGSEEGSARFNRVSILTAKVCGYNAAYGLTELFHPAGTIWIAGKAGPEGRKVRLIIKATDVVLCLHKAQDLSIRSAVAGEIAAIESMGPLAAVWVGLKGEERLCAVITRHALEELGLRCGAEVLALIKTSALDERQIASFPAKP